MKRWMMLFFGAALFAPMVVGAQSRVVVTEAVQVNAPARKVWDAIKDFDGLNKWHPAFASAVIIEGQNNRPGAKRKLTLKDGPSFDEELLEFDDKGMSLRYVILGDAPLPVAEYDSTLTVLPLGPKTSIVIWRGSFLAKGASDEDAHKGITGAYRAGLDNVKKTNE
jgi:mxaD protein